MTTRRRLGAARGDGGGPEILANAHHIDEDGGAGRDGKSEVAPVPDLHHKLLRPCPTQALCAGGVGSITGFGAGIAVQVGGRRLTRFARVKNGSRTTRRSTRRYKHACSVFLFGLPPPVFCPSHRDGGHGGSGGPPTNPAAVFAQLRPQAVALLSALRARGAASNSVAVFAQLTPRTVALLDVLRTLGAAFNSAATIFRQLKHHTIACSTSSAAAAPPPTPSSPSSRSTGGPMGRRRPPLTPPPPSSPSTGDPPSRLLL